MEADTLPDKTGLRKPRLHVAVWCLTNKTTMHRYFFFFFLLTQVRRMGGVSQEHTLHSRWHWVPDVQQPSDKRTQTGQGNSTWGVNTKQTNKNHCRFSQILLRSSTTRSKSGRPAGATLQHERSNGAKPTGSSSSLNEGLFLYPSHC